MFQFAHSIWLYALAFIAVYIVVYIYVIITQKRNLATFANPSLHQYIVPQVNAWRSAFKFTLYIIGASFLILAVADPLWGSKQQEVKRSGIDLVIAVDVSNSMLAQDIKPNRLMASQRALFQLIDKLNGDRLGLVVFGGQAYTQLPITTDYAAAKLAIDNMSTGMVPTQGTAIGAAIERAVEGFDKKSKNKKAIIVITDGENHEDDALKAAAAAQDEGIIVHTIGMGSAEGAPIPISAKDFKKDKDGKVVITKLNADALTQIAAEGKGMFVRASTSQVGLNQLYDEINKLQKTDYGSKEFSDYEHQYMYALFPAFLLLLLELILNNKRSNFWRKILKY
jgi:Ca-activated chloride channel homolog